MSRGSMYFGSGKCFRKCKQTNYASKRDLYCNVEEIAATGVARYICRHVLEAFSPG